MKKYMYAALIILLCGGLTACSDSSINNTSSHSKESYDIYIEVQCEKNKLFSKYDLEIYVDDEYQTDVKHGKTDSFEMNLLKGEHEIMIQKKDDASVKGNVTIDITSSAEYYYHVECKSDEVQIEQVNVSLRLEETKEDIVSENEKEIINTYTVDFKDAESLETALNNGEQVNGKLVQFEVLEYKPSSALGINCWAGEHLNFILEEELDVSAGDIIIGLVIEEASSVGQSSWKIPFEMIELGENDVIQYKTNEELSEEMLTESTQEEFENTEEALSDQELEVLDNQVLVPESSSMLEGDNFNEVLERFKAAGFSNIQTEAIYDLDCTSFWKRLAYEDVERVSINGNEEFKEGEVFEKDAIVIITYHLYEKDSPDIVYNKYTVAELFKDLEDNSMRAEKDHQDEYVEITGVISGISKQGKYILLYTSKEAWMELDTIFCETITDEQEDYLLNLSKGQKITLRGKIRSVDVLNPYSVDIYSFL